MNPQMMNQLRKMQQDMAKAQEDIQSATVEGAAGGGMVQEVTLFSPGPSIYGGTDQVQRNILGERVLGLPKEPGPAKDTPYKELLVNG